MDNKLRAEIESYAEECSEKLFKDIARLVEVESVMGQPEENAPFGPGPRKALDTALDISRELGLDVTDCEGRMGYASIGHADKYISTITHVDCVPAGNGWKADHLKMRERDGYIIGRGVMDDKGPTVLCLYALNFLRTHGIPLKYEVRALIGVNEENHMGDVAYYLKNYPAPVFCFSPDANFPVINGEKGILHGRIISAAAPANVVKIEGGFAANAIPDLAEAWVKADSLCSSENVEAEKDGELWHLTAHGISGHASLPEGTHNAIGVLAHYILDNNIADPQEAEYLRYICLLHDDYSGKLLGIDASDDDFTPLTAAGGMIYIADGKFVQSLDVRYPTSITAEEISGKLCAKADGCAEFVIDVNKVPFLLPRDNPAVRLCLDCYSEFTGESAEPMTIGGGTYARMFPNAVSFGPEHPERPMPEFVGSIHAAEEGASKEFLIEALKIYILTLIRLQELEF